MYQAQLPIPRAFHALLDVTRGALSQGRGRQCALTWLAAARMVTLGTAPGLKSLNELNTQSSWELLQAEGLPAEDIVAMFNNAQTKGGGLALGAMAVDIVKSLHNELGQSPWDVLPTLTVGRRFSTGADMYNDVIAPVADLMLDLVGVPENQTLWLPFDANGLMTIRALRRGWRVNAASMTDTASTDLRLLLAIETGKPAHPDVHTEIERDFEGRPRTMATHVIAIPPFGVQARHTRLAQWDLSGGKGPDQFDRSETMAVYELLQRVTQRAVFLVPPSVLFTRGQEQRLREYLLHRGGECNDLDSVIALPPGVLTETGIASALLVVGCSQNNGIRMVDLGSAKRTVTDVEDTVLAGRPLVLGIESDENRACFVSRDEIMANDCTLMPSRYLRKKVEVGPNAMPLGELCEVIRPPVLSKDNTGEDAVEAGIPDLGRWTRLVGPFTKPAKVRSRGRDTTSLKPGDILLSVKGSVGKAGLLGLLEAPKVVVSQNCLGLRVIEHRKGGTVSPEYLLMYLRSEAGQAQMEALKVGATVQHIGIATLMDAFLVPVPDQQAQQAAVDDYAKLCHLEGEISEIEKRIREISRAHWAL